jgi:two-component system, OmpR family, sensor kinase
MRRRLLAGFLLFAVIATALLVVPIGVTLQAHESSNTLRVLRRDTGALSVLLTDALNHDGVSRAVQLSQSYALATGRQVLVVANGRVALDSDPRESSDRRLIAIAQATGAAGKSGTARATSQEGSQYYVAADLTRVTTFQNAVLVVTSPVKVTNDKIHEEWKDLVLYGLLVLVLACFFGIAISGSLVRPLRRIGRDVEAVGNGELDVRVDETTGPSELRALARVINATSARLITLLESQRAFVEDASHQLRTPLTSLQLHLENLQVAEGVSNENDLNNVLAEMNRLSRMVDSLLALARNESKTPVLVPVDVRELVIERADVWRALAAEMELEIVIDVPRELRALVVEDVLEQVLDNLLSNAFDATPAGGRVEIEALAADEHVEIHVIDSGPGLGPVEREMALRRFWRGRENQSEGTGLGLSIVAQLVQLSGGSIELRDAEGRGLDATITLRRA